MDIGYFRVSKRDEKVQDLDNQIKAVKDKFDVPNLAILKERGSAYKVENITRREEFFKLLNILFDAENTTISDLFKGNITRKHHNLYVAAYDRISRKLEMSMFFQLLQMFYGNNTFSCKEGETPLKAEGRSAERLGPLIITSVLVQGGEAYSESISSNVKRSINIEKGITVSKEGKKWGRKFKDTKGNNVPLSVKQITSLNRRIIFLLSSRGASQKAIIDDITRRYGVSISNAYISKLKNGKT